MSLQRKVNYIALGIRLRLWWTVQGRKFSIQIAEPEAECMPACRGNGIGHNFYTIFNIGLTLYSLD